MCLTHTMEEDEQLPIVNENVVAIERPSDDHLLLDEGYSVIDDNAKECLQSVQNIFPVDMLTTS